MEYNPLGTSGIQVSRISLGCWSLVGDFNWGEQDERRSVEAIEAARDCGINFFDTAPGYGKGASEELLGRALEGWRDEAVIATKVSAGNLTADALSRACEESLQRLRTNYIDLYQIHWPNHEVPLDETAEALEKLQKEGKIRAYGVCNFGIQDLTGLLEHGQCTSNQLAYSLLARAIEYEIQPKCREKGVGILCYSPLAQGLLTGKFRSGDEVPEGRARTRHFSTDRSHARHGEPGCEQETFAAIGAVREIANRMNQPMERVALAWLLARPAVSAVIAGARDAEQVKRNAAADSLQLDAATVEELARATAPVKECLGANPDLWVGNGASRMR